MPPAAGEDKKLHRVVDRDCGTLVGDMPDEVDTVLGGTVLKGKLVAEW